MDESDRANLRPTPRPTPHRPPDRTPQHRPRPATVLGAPVFMQDGGVPMRTRSSGDRWRTVLSRSVKGGEPRAGTTVQARRVDVATGLAVAASVLCPSRDLPD